MLRCLLLLPLLLLMSCGQRHNNPGKEPVTKQDQPTEESAIGSDFYKRYSGTVAGKPVVVHLNCYGGKIQGSYCYNNMGQDVVLRGYRSPMAEDGECYLREQEKTAGMSYDSGTAWELHISGSKASGLRRSADGTGDGPIDLTEEYPEGCTRLEAFWLADSVALKAEDPRSPKAVATYGYLTAKYDRGSFLYNMLRRQIAPHAAHGEDMASALRMNMASYFGDYRQANEPLINESGTDLQALAFSYSNDQRVLVKYNDDNWLVTEATVASYTGGAHGNYASSFANIDVAQQRIWKLDDIITTRSDLRPLLNDAAIAYFGLTPGAGMENRLLVDEVPPTDNFYIGANGLSFVYNPYEIASYADGQITLFIPYKKLFHLLTPAFRQRKRLSEQAGVAVATVFHTKLIDHAGGRKS